MTEESSIAQNSPAEGSGETTPSQQPEAEDSFAELLALQEDVPSSRLEAGQRVKVTVVAVTDDAIFVSAGSKVDGIVEKTELAQDGISCAVGDTLDLYVAHVSPQEVRFSKVLRGTNGLEALEDARTAGLPVEGKVMAQVKGGFSVDIMRRRAFCPSGQMDLHPVDDPGLYLGKTLNFRIIKMEQHGRNIVLSRRVLQEAEQAENIRAFLERVTEGDTLEGAVRRLTPFGAFVELAPGVEGLAHVSELSWSRLTAPDELLSTGQNIRVKLLKVEQDDKGTRLSLSVRQVTEDPWNSVAERLHAGDLVSGRVARLTDFGAFTEILPGIEGLIHISELSWEKRVAKVQDILSAGEEVRVKIKEVNAEKRRISLSLRDAAGDPWASVAEDFALDSIHNGRLEKNSKFGLFITLAPGITGLMPVSFMARARDKNRLEKLLPGEEVQVRVAEMDLNARKITLSPDGEEAEEMPGGKESPTPRTAGRERPGGRRPSTHGRGGAKKEENADWRQHSAKGAATDSSFGGSLGLALAAALEKKKK